jgi:hypothetical protein
MAEKISQKEAVKYQEQNARLMKTITRAKKEGKKAVEAGIRTGAGMASAFGVTYIEQRYPKNNKVLGIDLSLLVGVVATGAGAFGLAGDEETSRVVEAVGNGALFAFAAKKGGKMGVEALQKAQSNGT